MQVEDETPAGCFATQYVGEASTGNAIVKAQDAFAGGLRFKSHL